MLVRRKTSRRGKNMRRTGGEKPQQPLRRKRELATEDSFTL